MISFEELVKQIPITPITATGVPLPTSTQAADHIQVDHIQAVRDMLASGQTDSKLIQAGFFAAVKISDCSLVQTLLERGAKINEVEDTTLKQSALHLAAEHASTEMLQLLLQHGADLEKRNYGSETPIFYAVKAKQIDSVKLLLEHGASLNVLATLGFTPLLNAIGDNSLEIVELLVKHTADLNRQALGAYSLPLCYAAAGGSLDVVRLLLKHGASPNKPETKNQDTAIYYAIEFSRLDIMEELLNYGANINWQDHNGRTPLHFAIGFESPLVIKFLLDKAADVTKVTNLGETPLHQVARSESRNVQQLLTIAHMLIEKGVPIDAVNHADQTALQLAIEHESLTMAALLLQQENLKHPSTITLRISEEHSILPKNLEIAHYERMLTFMRGILPAVTQSLFTALHRQAPIVFPDSALSRLPAFKAAKSLSPGELENLLESVIRELNSLGLFLLLRCLFSRAFTSLTKENNFSEYVQQHDIADLEKLILFSIVQNHILTILAKLLLVKLDTSNPIFQDVITVFINLLQEQNIVLNDLAPDMTQDRWIKRFIDYCPDIKNFTPLQRFIEGKILDPYEKENSILHLLLCDVTDCEDPLTLASELITQKVLVLSKSGLSKRDAALFSLFYAETTDPSTSADVETISQGLSCFTEEDSGNPLNRRLLLEAMIKNNKKLIEFFLRLDVMKLRIPVDDVTPSIEEEYGMILDSLPLFDNSETFNPLQLAACFGADDFVARCLQEITQEDILILHAQHAPYYNYFLSEIMLALQGYDLMLSVLAYEFGCDEEELDEEDKASLQPYRSIIRRIMCDKRWPGAFYIDFNHPAFVPLMQDKEWCDALRNKPLFLCSFPQAPEQRKIFEASITTIEELINRGATKAGFTDHYFNLYHSLQTYYNPQSLNLVLQKIKDLYEKCAPFFIEAGKYPPFVNAHTTSSTTLKDDELLNLFVTFISRYQEELEQWTAAITQYKQDMLTSLRSINHIDPNESPSLVLHKAILSFFPSIHWSAAELTGIEKALKPYLARHAGFIGINFLAIPSAVSLTLAQPYLILLECQSDAEQMGIEIIRSPEQCISMINQNKNVTTIQQLSSQMIATLSEVKENAELLSALNLNELQVERLKRWALQIDSIKSVATERMMQLYLMHYQTISDSDLPWLQFRRSDQHPNTMLEIAILYAHDMLQKCDWSEHARMELEHTLLHAMRGGIKHPMGVYDEISQTSTYFIALDELCLLSVSQQENLRSACRNMIYKSNIEIKFTHKIQELENKLVTIAHMLHEKKKSDLLKFAEHILSVTHEMDEALTWCDQSDRAMQNETVVSKDLSVRKKSTRVKRDHFLQMFQQELQTAKDYIDGYQLFQTELNLMMAEKEILKSYRAERNLTSVKLYVSTIETLLQSTDTVLRDFTELFRCAELLAKNSKFAVELQDFEHGYHALIDAYNKALHAIYADPKQTAVKKDKGKSKAKAELPKINILSKEKFEKDSLLWLQASCIISLDRLHDNLMARSILERENLHWYLAAQRLHLLYFAEAATQYLTQKQSITQTVYFPRFYKRLANSIVHVSFCFEQDPSLLGRLPNLLSNLIGFLDNHICRTIPNQDEKFSLLASADWSTFQLEQEHLLYDSFITLVNEIRTNSPLSKNRDDLILVFDTILNNIIENIEKLSCVVQAANEMLHALQLEALTMQLVDLGELAARVRDVLQPWLQKSTDKIDQELARKLIALEPIISLRNKIRHQIYIPQEIEVLTVCQTLLGALRIAPQERMSLSLSFFPPADTQQKVASSASKRP